MRSRTAAMPSPTTGAVAVVGARDVRPDAVGDCWTEAVAIADSTKVRKQSFFDSLIRAFQCRCEPQALLVIVDERLSEGLTTETVTFICDD